MNEYEIFREATEIHDQQRLRHYLDEACGGDAGLRAKVEQLLAARRAIDDFTVDHAMPDRRAAVADIESERSHDDSTETCEQDASGEVASPNELVLEVSRFLEPSERPGSLGRLEHYEIEEVIGRGGCGIVLRGHDVKLHRTVAIKLIAPELAATSPARKRFLREARAAAAITHQNVVRIYSVSDEPCPFLVMEYIAGRSLQQRLDKSGPFTTEEVSRWGLQIVQGLAASHAKKVVHRDIKPANILLESDTNQIKITDFGLARTVDDASLTQSGMITGTPLYMSPEQAQGMAVDHRSDLFSLGSVLYALCAGRPPFRATSTLSTLKRLVEQEPRPVQEIIPEIPSWLAALIQRLHAKDPAARFQSASEVAEVWKSALRHKDTLSVNSRRVALAAEVADSPPIQTPTTQSKQRWSQLKVIVTVISILLGIPLFYMGMRMRVHAHHSDSIVKNESASRDVAVPAYAPVPTPRPYDFREIHGASETQIQQWASNLPEHYLPTWISPRRYLEPVVFDAVALDVKREIDYVIQFIHDDWAEDVRKQYESYEDSGYVKLCRSIYNDSAVMIWTDASYGDEASFWWGSQTSLNDKIIEGLKYEKQIADANYRWLPASLNVAHRDVPYYEGVFRWEPYVDCIWYWSLTPELLQSRVEHHLQRGWRLHRVSMHENSDTPLFTAIFVVSETTSDWEFAIYANEREYQQAVATQRSKRMSLRCLSTWMEHDEVRSAVLWSQ